MPSYQCPICGLNGNWNKLSAHVLSTGHAKNKLPNQKAFLKKSNKGSASVNNTKQGTHSRPRIEVKSVNN